MDFLAQSKPLIFERSRVKAALTRFRNFFETSANTVTADVLRNRLEANTSLLEKFNNIQDQIDDLAIGTDFEAPQSAERDSFETLYFDIITAVQNRISQLRPSGLASATVPVAASPAISETQLGVKLPTIKLPTFDGDYSSWVRFRDTFESIIHSNESLSSIQKFHYLSSSLKGQAERVVQTLGISHENYEVAWARLKKRYEDSFALIRHHVNALLDLPSLSRESYQPLRAFIDDVNNHLASLRSLGEPVDYWDTVLIIVLAKKLPPLSKCAWEKRLLNTTDKPTMQHFKDFIEYQYKYLERTTTDSQVANVTPQVDGRNQARRPKPGPIVAHVASKQVQCPLCKEMHMLCHCNKYRNLDHAAKLDTLKKFRACFNCLQSGHMTKSCTRSSCRKCGKKHHTSIHLETATSPVETDNVASNAEPLSTDFVQATQSYVANSETVSNHVLLATAIVNVKDNRGRIHECRALLDAGSQAHFVTEEFCKRIGAPRTAVHATVGGICRSINTIRSTVNFEIASQYNGFKASISCFILPTITNNMPSVSFNSSITSKPPGINIADPRFNESRKIDLLIGSALFWKLLCIGQIKVKSHDLIWQKTQLGWVLAGNFSNFSFASNTAPACHLATDLQLERAISKFWEVENCIDENEDSDNNVLTNRLERHFIDTTTRTDTGRYVVNIPFNEKLPNLGDSRAQALKRFYSIERKFKTRSALKERYVAFMKEYEALGHMTRLPRTIAIDGYYLPHHAVFKHSSTTTKLRVVFDGSAKTTTGISINDAQEVGPPVQDDLFSILTRFRTHKVVISADVAKMYRQILVKPEQRKFQRILWRADEHEPISEFQLNTVTYGTAASSFLATRVLRQIGVECSDHFPCASRAIIHDFYVDDLLSGANSAAEAIQLKREISKVLSACGMQLRKWASNNARVVSVDSDREIEIDADKDPKTLGLVWNTQRDGLRYSVNPPQTARITKRIILSEISRIFDPLGLIGPVIVQAKMLMQALWQLKSGWDESIPQEIYSRWSAFRGELLHINELIIPRRVSADGSVDVQLHGFSDASEKAYGACVYLRTIGSKGESSVRLLCSKSRVAPLKTISLPRLELCGAGLLAQLMHRVKKSINIEIHSSYYWTDSTIVLAWLNAPSNKWKVYVANRVSEIQQITQVSEWRHVPTQDNPADIISRGLGPILLATTDIWWNGPLWLSDSSVAWPSTAVPVEEQLELRPVHNSFHTVLDSSIFDRFSSFTRLNRVIAYCLRFREFLRKNVKSHQNQCRTLQQPTFNPLTTQELYRARISLIKVAQREYFDSDIRALIGKHELPRSSQLIALNPFLDTEGLLRVGGRLTNAMISYDQRHPIVLPPNHKFTKLLIEYEHLRLLHAGCQQVVSSLRGRYWPLSCKPTVKAVLRACVKCFRVRPTTTEPIMGNLPSNRVTIARPFFNSGVDFAGPFFLKEKTRSKVFTKAYLCVFVCFSTKAVHLDLSVDLSTEAFLRCLRRFVARRGRSGNIYSDNGTNFVGASRELRNLLNDCGHQQKVSDYLTSEEIQWHFIPPHSPNFGGLWEGAVKSAKYHLKRVIGEQRLTFEEFYTVLTQVESCLNSRPLSPISDDPNDLLPLSPGHFLIGEAMTALPYHDLRDVKDNRLNRYQLLQKMLQHFWSRWSTEYLHTLQQRGKWKWGSASNIRVGTMVVIKDDNLPPLRWRLGRILQLHPGKDEITRVVTVTTSDGVIKRPTSKVCILPIQDSSPASQPL